MAGDDGSTDASGVEDGRPADASPLADAGGDSGATGGDATDQADDASADDGDALGDDAFEFGTDDDA
jgi:hypothetical protein